MKIQMRPVVTITVALKSLVLAQNDEAGTCILMQWSGSATLNQGAMQLYMHLFCIRLVA